MKTAAALSVLVLNVTESAAQVVRATVARFVALVQAHSGWYRWRRRAVNRAWMAIAITLGHMLTSACTGGTQRVNLRKEKSAAAELARQEAAATAAKSESVRVVLAAINFAKGTSQGSRTLMLSAEAPNRTPHDSATLAAVSQSFVRVIDPRASQILDTVVVSFGLPVRQTDGYVIGVMIGGSFRCANGRIGSSSTGYQLRVRCTAEVCTSEQLSAIAGDGFCFQQNEPR